MHTYILVLSGQSEFFISNWLLDEKFCGDKRLFVRNFVILVRLENVEFTGGTGDYSSLIGHLSYSEVQRLSKKKRHGEDDNQDNQINK